MAIIQRITQRAGLSPARVSFARAEVALAVAVIALGGPAAAPVSAQCLANELQKLTASDATFGDHFGISVCILGDLAISGAAWANVEQYLAGAAYIYRKDPITTQWLEEQKVVPEDPGPLDWFGMSVDINPLDPNVIIVGAWANDDADDCGNDPTCESGSAYIFRFDTDLGQWIQEQKLTASDADSRDYFGWAVSIWGDVAMVGARLDDDPDQDTGSVYVFRYDRVTQTWQEQQKLIPSDWELSGRFGTSLSLEDDVVVIGSPTNREAGFQAGAAYVFRYDPKAQLWVEEQKLLPSDPGSGDIFGSSVSLNGDFALIGAPGHNVNGVSGAGAAYVFGFNGGQWVEQQQFTASTPGFFNRFGLSVSLQDNIAVIGTPAADDGEPIAGSVSIFVYDPDALQWTEQATLHSSDLEIGDFFGRGVSIDGDRVIVGAPFDDDDGSESGSAYVFGGLGDCNDNGELDLCDIADGFSTDENNNGIPDECEPPPCPWDLDGNGSVGVSDLLILLGVWGPCPPKGDCPADFDGSGEVGVSDFLDLLGNWGPCP